MMSLQAHRMEQLDQEADELIKAGKQTGESATPEPTTEEQAAISDAVVTGEQTPESGETPPAQPASQPSVSADEVTKLRQDLEKSEWRYKSLQGMYEKLKEDNDELRRLVKVMGETKPVEPAPAAPKLISEKDVEAYGGDMIDMVRRAAEEIISSKLGDIDGKITKVGERAKLVEEVVQQTAKDRFESNLTLKVPDWKEIDLDPAFSGWLGKYGLQALGAAYAAGDLEATAKFFEDYKQLTGMVAPEPPAPPASQALETKVAPGKAKTSTSAPPASARVWTAADINKLYEDERKGRITPEQFAALETDLFKAQSEGRVQ